LPVVQGRKTEREKFPGADTTYAIEALMQDGKALQCGTSHNLGQNFAKAFDIQFLGRDQKQHLTHTTSWGVSTRLIGALIMAHSDDDGLVLPPRVAPQVAAIVPIFRNDEERERVRGFTERILKGLVGEEEIAAAAARENASGIESYFFDKITHQRIAVDWRDARPGEKHFHWEQRGVPFRLEVGPRDVDAESLVLKSRLDRGKETVRLDAISADWLRKELEAAQDQLCERARRNREENTRRASSYEELRRTLDESGGFVRCYFEPGDEAEEKIQEETRATVRCIPFDQPTTPGTCILSGKETNIEVLFAQAY
jgi:prolyl-tRNA synthetase